MYSGISPFTAIFEDPVVPLYEYQCTKCDNRFERIQKFSDPLVTDCPLCGGKVERTISVPAVHFKGSGWYVTDYANKNSASKAGGKSEEKSGTDLKAEGKSDGKSSESKSSDSKSSESKVSESKSSGSKSSENKSSDKK
jgi:putative FmdB family regulatory protein